MQNEDLLQHLRALIHEPDQAPEDMTPLKDYQQAGSVGDYLAGQRFIAEGRVGCIVVAGGQGSRLGSKKPKGLFPISAVKRKTLFQLLAERVLAASKLAGRALFLAIMTSRANNRASVEYFIANNFFGLPPDCVFFFEQGELPFLDAEGHPLLTQEGTALSGPDGNGGALEAFCSTHIAGLWAGAGVRWVNFIQIDNPLADPFDAELVGYHARTQQEVTIKSVMRKNLAEPVGTLVQTEAGIRVVEYSELPEKQRQGHKLANISCFCFSMNFIKRAKVTRCHKAWKKVKAGLHAWKFERFIFDALSQAHALGVLVYERATCFAPLKNAAGEDSPTTVTAALIEADKRAYEAVSGLPAPAHLFEVHPQFYYPTQELIDRWHKRPVGEETYLI